MAKKKPSTTTTEQKKPAKATKKSAKKQVDDVKKMTHKQALEDIFETAQNIIPLTDAMDNDPNLIPTRRVTLTDPTKNDEILVDIVAYGAEWVKFFKYFVHLLQKSINEKN